MSLIFEDLSVVVSKKPVVSQVNIKLSPGQVIALMGPNGSGKSSLGYAVMGHPDYRIISGAIKLDGKDITHLPPDEKSQKGLFLAFQYPVSVEGVRYERFLWEAYKLRFSQDLPKTGPKLEDITEFRQHLLQLARSLKIKPELLERSINLGFSGGEKKRLEVLSLLLLEPQYAILDETDSGLDIDAIKVVADGINQAVKKIGTGVLLITHYQRILNYIKPDEVLVMKSGKIVVFGGKELVKKLEKEGYEKL